MTTPRFEHGGGDLWSNTPPLDHGGALDLEYHKEETDDSNREYAKRRLSEPK